MSQKYNENTQQFVDPTPEKVENLGPGCFVRVHENNQCYWVEIEQRDGGRFSGTIHRELGSKQCNAGSIQGNRVEFTKDQISVLGCDNFCWC